MSSKKINPEMIEKMPKWHLEKRFLQDLTPHPNNPRYLTKEDEEQLSRSLVTFGMIERPIITYEGQIIGGHQRVEILKTMGIKELECWVIDTGHEDTFTPQKIEELMLRLNKNTGDWDMDKLANNFDVNDLMFIGFNESDFEDKLPKEKKKQIIFDFENDEDIDEFVDKFNRYCVENTNFIKMRVKK